MRIAIFTDTYPPQINGVSHVAASSVKALLKLGHDVRVFSPNDIPSLPLWGYPGERVALPIGSAYRKALLFKPDIIHSHMPFIIGWEAVALAWKHRIPLVGTHHTFFDHYLKHIHMDFAWTRYLSWKYAVGYYNRCDIVLSPSMALLNGMKSNGLKKKCIIFPNAIDTNFFIPAGIAEKDRLKKRLGIKDLSMIYMGRVSYEKSLDQVIGAFKIVHDAKPEVTLLIVGDGPERKKLELQSKELGIRESVIFTGALRDSNLRDALQASDIFVTASKSENMPLSVMEAMSTGLPAIGVDSLGMPEVIRNEQNGYIVPPNDIKGIAEKALILIENKEVRSRFSIESRKLSLNYGEEENSRKLEEIYNSLILNK